MVPVPDKLYNKRVGRPSEHIHEGDALATCCPDWHGLVLPPLKEAAKKDWRGIWGDVYSPDYTAAEKEQDRWSYAALNVMMRTLLKKKYDPGHWLYVSRPVDEALRHVKKEDKEIYSGKPFWVYKDFDEIDVKKALRDVEAWMRANPDKFPPEAIEDFKKLFPVAVEAAKPIGKFMKVLAEKAREEMKRRGNPRYTPADYLRDMVKEQGIPPQLHLPNYLTQEEIEKIHLAHRLLYELLGMHARVMFEKKSGMEELLGEERVRELEEEVQRLKRGEHLKKIFGETPTRKTAAVPRPPVVQKRTAPPRRVQEEKQKTTTQQPAKKVPFTIDDVDMSKVEKPQVTGRIVAIFEERTFAEEFASLKGGKVIQTPEGKYAVVLEDRAKQQMSGKQSAPKPSEGLKGGDTAEKETHTPAKPKRHWVEEVLGVPKGLIKRHPETGYEYVEKDGKIIVLPTKDPRELGMKGPDPAKSAIFKIVLPSIVAHSKKPAEEILELAKIYKELEEEIRAGKIKSENEVKEQTKKKIKELEQKGYTTASVQAGFLTQSVWSGLEKSIEMEHVAGEYRYIALVLYDAAKLVNDMLKNPEKYGLKKRNLEKALYRGSASEKIFKKYIVGRYLRFHG
ncbi:hypothetical protein [Thermococcus henrietii]|uniref:hypothetical protein n=1 Tax=Thermococcus henrietii TaxID=2016361 RepID=UPI000C078CA8|nr:hypothetical protein [Thermococcus henrietii]